MILKITISRMSKLSKKKFDKIKIKKRKTLKALKTLKKEKKNVYKKIRKSYKKQTGGERLLFRVGGKNTTIEYENDKDLMAQIEYVMSQFKRPYQKTEYKSAVTYALQKAERSAEDIDRIFSNKETLTQLVHHAELGNNNDNGPPPPPLPPKRKEIRAYVIDMDLIFSNAFRHICESLENEQECKDKILEKTKVKEQNLKEEQNLKDLIAQMKSLKTTYINLEHANAAYIRLLERKLENASLARFIDFYFASKEVYDYLVDILTICLSLTPQPYVFFISSSINLAILKMMLTSVDEFNKQICARLLRGSDLEHINVNDGKITDDDKNFSYLDKYFLVPEALKTYEGVKPTNSSDQLRETITQSFSKIFGTEQSGVNKKINIEVVSHEFDMRKKYLELFNKLRIPTCTFENSVYLPSVPSVVGKKMGQNYFMEKFKEDLQISIV
jgi:hypothetical protein